MDTLAAMVTWLFNILDNEFDVYGHAVSFQQILIVFILIQLGFMLLFGIIRIGKGDN